MANLNKVMLIGRLTRDPEVRTFGSGGKVAAFGFAVTNRKKNQQTGEWEDDPMFIDVDAFNRESGRKLADLVEQYLKKGHQAYIEGSLKLDQWTDKEGQKRSKIKLVLHDMQFLEPRAAGAGDEGGGRSPRGPAPRRSDTGSGYGAPARDDYEPQPEGPGRAPEDDIPF
jgi:single-strand DNA-binding protein